MTISTLLVILALTVGTGTSQLSESDSTSSATRPAGTIEGNCWINGVWYNPCTIPPEPQPSTNPKIQPLN